MRYEDKSIYNKLKKGKFRLEIGAVADNSQNMLVSRKETFPHLWAIKQTNIRTEDQSRFNPHISPIGYHGMDLKVTKLCFLVENLIMIWLTFYMEYTNII